MGSRVGCNRRSLLRWIRLGEDPASPLGSAPEDRWPAGTPDILHGFPPEKSKEMLCLCHSTQICLMTGLCGEGICPAGWMEVALPDNPSSN